MTKAYLIMANVFSDDANTVIYYPRRVYLDKQKAETAMHEANGLIDRAKDYLESLGVNLFDLPEEKAAEVYDRFNRFEKRQPERFCRYVKFYDLGYTVLEVDLES